MKLITALVTASALAMAASFSFAQGKPAAPKSVRVYVFDGGKLDGGDPSRFSLKREEMAVADMSIAAYLVVHPRGVLMWDSGALPDEDLTSAGTMTRYRIVLPNGNERFVTTSRTLASQLAQTGYSPRDVTYLALSHYHYDHTGNANMFAGSTWLVRQAERDVMFPDKPNDLTRNSRLEVDARTHARPSGAVPEARQDRTARHLRRSLPLPGRTETAPRADVRRRSEANGSVESGAGGVHAEGGRAAVDPARPRRASEAQEGA
jgi:glyoxylase-like metal-dependent hydrolase (beta-lactamase superfamily II)